MSRKEWGYIFRVLRDFRRKNNKALIQLLVLSVLEAVKPFIAVVMMGLLLDAVYQSAPYGQLVEYAGIGVGSTLLLSCINSWLRERFNAKNEFINEIQDDIINEKTMQLDYEYLENTGVQELRRKIEQANSFFGLMGKVLMDTEEIIKSLVMIIVSVTIVIPLFFVSGDTTYGFIGTPVASFLLLLVIGCLVYGNYRIGVVFGIKNKEYADRYTKAKAKRDFYCNHLLASYEAQKDLRIYHQQDLIEKEIEKISKKYVGINRECCRYMQLRAYLSQVIVCVSGMLVYLFAGLRAYVGMISIGGVVTYAATILKFTNAFSDLMTRLGALKELAMYGENYCAYMDLKQKKNTEGMPVNQKLDGTFQVEFENVSFRYPGTKEDVISHLNLKFTIGEKMAIVGKNGSGKTTFIKLLCRLYDVTDGCIKINGVDIRKYNYEDYLALFSVVFQDYRMFAFPLGENIAASAQVEDEKALDALRRAGLKERLENLKNGLHTCVGKEFEKDGVSFSGGERQKMAIARAIYKSAPFVIMDEPTAALDPMSECDVYAGFDEMVGQKTAIYISHRLASCRFCQEILVFDRGKVVQRGSHEELVKKAGVYQEMWNAQAQYYQG